MNCIDRGDSLAGYAFMIIKPALLLFMPVGKIKFVTVFPIISKLHLFYPWEPAVFRF